MKSPSSMDTLVFIIGLASLALRAQCSDIALYGGKPCQVPVWKVCSGQFQAC